MSETQHNWEGETPEYIIKCPDCGAEWDVTEEINKFKKSLEIFDQTLEKIKKIINNN